MQKIFLHIHEVFVWCVNTCTYYTPSHRKPFTSFSVHHKFKKENTQTHAFQILEKWKIIVTCYFAFWSSSKIYWLKHKWSEFHYNIAFILYTWEINLKQFLHFCKQYFSYYYKYFLEKKLVGNVFLSFHLKSMYKM